jgi:predicted unusual protein kinase regulating ubiquinone biosynthesis (AarF/ABC1/UbiB family)
LETESLEKQKLFLRSLAEGEYVTATEIYFLLSTRLPRVDLSVIKAKLVRIWRVWETRVHIGKIPYEQKSLTYMTGEVNRVVYDSQFAALWSFSKLTRTWVHLDNALAYLAPDFNYLRHLRLYLKESQGRQTVSEIRQLPHRLASSLNALHEIPERISDYTLFQEILMRRKAQMIQGSASKIDAVLAAGFAFISFLTLLVTMFLLTVFLMQYQYINLKSLLGPQLSRVATLIPYLRLPTWLILLAFFMISYICFRSQKKRFSRQEFGRQETNIALT